MRKFQFLNGFIKCPFSPKCMHVNLGKFRKTPNKKEIGDTAKIMAEWKEKARALSRIEH